MVQIADRMDIVVKAPGDETRLARVAREVAELCDKYPAPGIRV
jgi:glycine/serine hydroxymethyltransferase